MAAFNGGYFWTKYLLMVNIFLNEGLCNEYSSHLPILCMWFDLRYLLLYLCRVNLNFFLGGCYYIVGYALV